MILELLRADGSITVNKNLIQAIGLNEAVLYCELLSRYFYFESRLLLDEEGCFYNTQYDFLSGNPYLHRFRETVAIRCPTF